MGDGDHTTHFAWNNLKKEDEILDIQKELENKFDELFGSADDE